MQADRSQVAIASFALNTALGKMLYDCEVCMTIASLFATAILLISILLYWHCPHNMHFGWSLWRGPFVRPSVPSIDSSKGRWRVCCWAPSGSKCGQCLVDSRGTRLNTDTDLLYAQWWRVTRRRQTRKVLARWDEHRTSSQPLEFSSPSSSLPSIWASSLGTTNRCRSADITTTASAIVTSIQTWRAPGARLRAASSSTTSDANYNWSETSSSAKQTIWHVLRNYTLCCEKL